MSLVCKTCKSRSVASDRTPASAMFPLKLVESGCSVQLFFNLECRSAHRFLPKSFNGSGLVVALKSKFQERTVEQWLRDLSLVTWHEPHPQATAGDENSELCMT
jgi:hypothetical protein